MRYNALGIRRRLLLGTWYLTIKAARQWINLVPGGSSPFYEPAHSLAGSMVSRQSITVEEYAAQSRSLDQQEHSTQLHGSLPLRANYSRLLETYRPDPITHLTIAGEPIHAPVRAGMEEARA
jgi:hypothetical protein